MTDRKRALLDSAVRIIARQGVRGLRVEEVARHAGVSTALIYHHFGDRSNLLQSALLHVEQTAEGYTLATEAISGRDVLIATVLGEFQDDSNVRDNSAAWGELRDAAIFDESLRPTLAVQTEQWIDRLAGIIVEGQTDGSISTAVDPHTTGQRLTALIEGLSSRWLSGLISTDEARSLIETAVVRELEGAVATSAETSK
ncbi:MAG: TetR family transcriptional regulator [Gammaproteobacteria bacterium]|nr:TetR family transcriptional regulator [Gammaproteobacteria bacterium]